MNDKPTSALGDLPEGVETVMFLRDGWPLAVVCKVTMKDRGRVGIGICRWRSKTLTLEQMDAAALADAMRFVDTDPPDYTELHEHVAKMTEAAKARTAAQEQPDHDLQASLGQPAR